MGGKRRGEKRGRGLGHSGKRPPVGPKCYLPPNRRKEKDFSGEGEGYINNNTDY